MSGRRPRNPELPPLARRLGWIALALSSLLPIAAVFETPIWSPRDEVAHFDFIDQLASLHYPSPDSLISDHTAELCREHFEWIRPASYNGGRKSMGLAGWSYESQNPPLYYALLAPLQRVSLLVGVSPRTEVIALRLAGVLAFILGCLLLLLGFRELHNRFAVPEVYGVMLAVIALTTQHQTIATLGNDVLSFPFSVATCLFALRTCRAPTWQNRLGLALLAGLAPLVKLTNIPLLALPLIVAMCVRVRDRDATRWWPEASTALATLPTALFLGVSAWRSGKLLGSSVARDAFATFVEPLRPFSEFLGVLTADSFQLQLVGLAGTRWVVSASFGLLFLAALQSVVWLTLRKRRADAIFHLVSVGVVATTIAGSWFLNDRIPGVHWHVFRHYFWCLPFWLFAFLATPLRLTILGTTWIRRGTP